MLSARPNRGAYAQHRSTPDTGAHGVERQWGFSVDDISPNDIYGIELYDGPATVPRELLSLGASASCGLVMIWTR